MLTKKEQVLYWMVLVALFTGVAFVGLRPLLDEPEMTVQVCVGEDPHLAHGQSVIWVDCERGMK